MECSIKTWMVTVVAVMKYSKIAFWVSYVDKLNLRVCMYFVYYQASCIS